MYSLNIQLREYQKKIIEKASKLNTLVVLPTGLGKTIIALKLAIDRVNKFKDQKVLFLAPTKPLVEQHAKLLLEISNVEKEFVAIITGRYRKEKRAKLWKNALFIFATPQTIENDLKNGVISLDEVCLIIFDEAHRGVGNYSYTYIAKEYVKTGKNILILALTASPGYTKEHIKEVIDNLFIEHVELKTERDEDVRPYIKKKYVEIVKVELPFQIKKVKNLLKEVYKEKINSLKEVGLRIPTKTKLIELYNFLAKKVKTNKKYFAFLRKAVEAIKISHALELIQTQGVKPTLSYLEKLESSKSKITKSLMKDDRIREALNLCRKLKNESIEIGKFDKLIEIIKKEKSLGSKKFIVFANFRKTVEEIVKKLSNANIKAKAFVGQREGLSQKEQKKVLEAFANDEFEVLVATSIGEEGIHIASVDVAIFFDEVPSALRSIQRKGRVGRTKVGKIYLLMNKGTIDEGYSYISRRREKMMEYLIKYISEKNKLQRKLFSFKGD